MPSTGFLQPASIAGASWSDKGNVTADDNIFANCVAFSDTLTGSLIATGFGAVIPVTATVTGAQVKFGAKDDGVGNMVEYEVQLVKGGSIVGANRSLGVALTASKVSFTRGGSSDLWDISFTPAEAMASNTGFAINFLNDDPDFDATAYVDYMFMNFHYTESAKPWSMREIIQYA